MLSSIVGFLTELFNNCCCVVFSVCKVEEIISQIMGVMGLHVLIISNGGLIVLVEA